MSPVRGKTDGAPRISLEVRSVFIPVPVPVSLTLCLSPTHVETTSPARSSRLLLRLLLTNVSPNTLSGFLSSALSVRSSVCSSLLFSSSTTPLAILLGRRLSRSLVADEDRERLWEGREVLEELLLKNRDSRECEVWLTLWVEEDPTGIAGVPSPLSTSVFRVSTEGLVN